MAPIICGLKWLLSSLVIPVGFVAAIAGIVFLITTGTRAYRDRREKAAPEAQRVLWKISNVAATVFYVFMWVFIGCFVLGIFVGSAMTIMPYWGCDHCLPEWLQTQCNAKDAPVIRQQDAAEVKKLCDKWGWTPPDMTEGAK